jgi:hypothetical protein
VTGQGQRLEAGGVHGLGGHGQPVAAGVRLHHAGQQPPQARDERLEGVGRPRRRVLVPDRVDQLAGGHHPPGVEGQAQQQPPQPRPGHLDGTAGTGPHLQRAQDADVQAAGHVTILPVSGGRVGDPDHGPAGPAGPGSDRRAREVRHGGVDSGDPGSRGGLPSR